MTVRRLAAIVVIFLGCTLAWFSLGASVQVRTGEFDQHLRHEVTLLWGGAHTQVAPEVWIGRPREVIETVVEAVGDTTVNRKVTKTVTDWAVVPPTSTRADAALDLAHRKKGLLWYDTYEVAFRASYVFENPDDVERQLRVRFKFPAAQAVYDEFVLTLDGMPVTRTGDLSKEIDATATIASRARVTLAVGYRSRGLSEWRYAFASDGAVEVRDFLLAMRTNFRAVDFPAGTMSPSAIASNGDGMDLTWRFSNVVSGQAIGMDLPQRVNPGPLVSRITFFAPVSLLFFLTVMVMLDVRSGTSMHPMNYFFISAAFFAFHLLLAYLVDHISVHTAFGIAAVVSIALVASYLRVVVGAERRLWPAAAAQAIYLVAFSYAFFFEGLTGLTVAIGAVLTLFVLMRMTAKVRWADVFTPRTA